MRTDEILLRAIRKAQEIARKEGLKIGAKVACPNDDMTYRLERIEGETAYVMIPASHSSTGEVVRKAFPLSEIFDLEVAREEGIKIALSCFHIGGSEQIQ